MAPEITSDKPSGNGAAPRLEVVTEELGTRNLRQLASSARLWQRLLAAVGSGLLLSAAFPPLELDGVIWIALVPLLLTPAPPTLAGRAALGWLLGFAHFATCLAWLNTIGFAAGVLLALACACFPMCWYVIVAALPDAIDRRAGAARGGPTRTCNAPAAVESAAGECLLVLLIPIVWVALEWCRGWVLTGFPWNQLGISQYRRSGLLALTTVTGVYGISFLILAVNAALAMTVRRWRAACDAGAARKRPWPLAVAALMFIPVPWLARLAPRLGAPDSSFRALAVQGNIEQCRQWTPGQLDLALEIYTSLSRETAAVAHPDIIIWPETAVPAPLRWDEQYRAAMHSLLEDVNVPMLVGSIDYRETAAEPVTDSESSQTETPVHGFNTAFLLDADGTVRDYYDKTHLVPFGEYTPLEACWPWLTKLIGMGRGLTPGSEFTVLALPGAAQAGVNICYEDAYPGISREFVKRGANLLVTLTNDAWYAESAGPRQHLVHAVFRAVENRRPLFRSGNNSDTCLILPDGSITELLADPVSGNRFVRGAKTYEIPIWQDPGYTFYSLRGDVFAKCCALAAAAVAVALAAAWLHRKQQLWERITGNIASAPGLEPGRSQEDEETALTEAR